MAESASTETRMPARRLPLSSVLVTILTLATAQAQKPASPQVPAAAPQNCLRATDPVSGTLRQVSTRHPNGTPIEVMQLRLDRPGCMVVPGLDGTPRPMRFQAVHLVSQDPALRARLRNAAGSRATVQGGDVMEPHTAWHIGDLVMLDVRILRLAPP
jgi:hypothetical protein